MVPTTRRRHLDVRRGTLARPKNTYKSIVKNVAFLRNFENDVNFAMKMTSDWKLLLISFVKLLKFCKNKFLKCCFLAEFKRWHMFLCADDLWSKIVTNKFIMLVKFCKNQFLKFAFFAEFNFPFSYTNCKPSQKIWCQLFKFCKKATF